MNRVRITAALALVATPLAAQQGGTVRLRFDWRPGTRAEVDYEQVRLRNVGGRVDTLHVASTYRMEVSAHAAGIAIAYSGTRWTELHSTDPVLGPYYQAMARTTSGGRGRTVVGPGGRFLRVEGAQEIAGELDQALGPVLADMDASTVQSIRQAASTLTSPQALGAAAENDWNALVGTWLGMELTIGQVVAVERSFRTPVFPGVTIPLHMQFRAAGRVRCAPADAEERCVRLELASIPDQEVVARAIRDFLERAGTAFEDAQATLAQANVQSFIILHTEPQTLRPYLLQYRRVVKASRAEDAPIHVDTRTFRFRYLP
ncbi:MAG TPA: hypothetical protein VFJ82_23440 [Longimicrobium sp.]|nr:hypothetical protein [Longimicrobium sp.]